jgi:molecular chaperone DnaK
MERDFPRIFRQFYVPHLKRALEAAAGQGPNVVRDEPLFRQVVIDAGWAALPLPLRKRGRDTVRWDEFLLVARKECYLVKDNRLTLRGDTDARLEALVEKFFGVASLPMAQLIDAPAPAPAAPRPAPAPAAPAPRPVPAPAAPAGAAAPPHEVAVGIDLGTTYSVVAHLDAYGRPVSIPNAAGDIITPSVILVDDAVTIVGKEAVQAAAMEPEKVAVVVKRDMGSKYYHKKVNGELMPPEVLSSLILRTLKEDAERKLGKVRKAVITVPAYFDESRRRATMDAGRMAGLQVLDIINEPTAAAIAYGHEVGFLNPTGATTGDRPLRVLVYDLGGGTFDVTIVEIHGTSFKALATDGDVALGGKDWDKWLVDHAAEEFMRKHREDPRAHPGTLQEMWVSAEVAKKTLSERPRASLYVNHLGARHKVEFTREQFEDATGALLGRTRTTCEIVVRQAGLRWADLDRVLLVGGSTRMPAVPRMIEELTGKQPDRSISPDEAVAHGAALYADLVLKQQIPGTAARFSVTNINSHSLGIVGVDPQTGRKRNQILIPKNTPLPHTRHAVFKTNKASQPNVAIRVVEGESERPEACIDVGVCTVALPAGLPAGWPVQISYHYAADGRLEVTAQIKGHAGAMATLFQRERNMDASEIEMWQTYFAGRSAG